MSKFSIVDSHVHLLDTTNLTYPFFSSNPHFNNKYLPADYSEHIEDINVEKIVFLECNVLPNQALDEAKWIESLSMKNIFIKIPGQGEYTKRPKKLNENFDLGDVPPLVDIVYKKYGSEKMMWGSDFPPCAGREGYMNTLKSIENNKIFTSKKHMQNVIGNTAAKIWGFE